MPIVQTILNLETESNIGIYNVTPEIQAFLASTNVQNGQILVFSRHTTTALAVNEYEPRLLEDIKTYLRKLAPESEKYLHNDLHLRKNIPEDEPMNAHSHLMAMTLSTSEIIPVIDGNLGLGTYQSILFIELDGPRHRSLLVQASGE
jgi:secondary thiamine-phosphate synthase enzyme